MILRHFIVISVSLFSFLVARSNAFFVESGNSRKKTGHSTTSIKITSYDDNVVDNDGKYLETIERTTTRRGFVSAAILASSSFALLTDEGKAWAAEGVEIEESGVKMFKNPSGLKYIELKEGTGVSPNYGQLLSIKYTGYIKIPNKDKKKFDSNTYLMKHGNGRAIAGLDEGVHTMKVGGIRRIIIPPKLGYVDSGLGPLPEMPWNRNTLSNLLDEMVEVRGGNVIFDVELRNVLDDEADQGYYTDQSPTPEEIEIFKSKINQKAATTIGEQQQQEQQQAPIV